MIRLGLFLAIIDSVMSVNIYFLFYKDIIPTDKLLVNYNKDVDILVYHVSSTIDENYISSNSITYGSKNDNFANINQVQDDSLIFNINYMSNIILQTYNFINNNNLIDQIKAKTSNQIDTVYTSFPNILVNLIKIKLKANKVTYIVDCNLYSYLSSDKRLSVYTHKKEISFLSKVQLFVDVFLSDFLFLFMAKQHTVKFQIDNIVNSSFINNNFNLESYEKCNLEEVSGTSVFTIIGLLLLAIALIIRRILIWMFCSCSKTKNKKIKNN